MHRDKWRNYTKVKEIDESQCFYVLRAMVLFAKRGWLVEESQYWLPVVELILPLMTSQRQAEDPQAYEEVMISLKMITLKSYDESLSINDYLNANCVVLETPEFKFLNNIKGPDFDANY